MPPIRFRGSDDRLDRLATRTFGLLVGPIPDGICLDDIKRAFEAFGTNVAVSPAVIPSHCNVVITLRPEVHFASLVRIEVGGHSVNVSDHSTRLTY